MSAEGQTYREWLLEFYPSLVPKHDELCAAWERDLLAHLAAEMQARRDECPLLTPDKKSALIATMRDYPPHERSA